MIASAHITICDLNDPIQQGTAPSSPVTGMLWLDTSVFPNQLKRWDGSEWATVNDPAAIDVGGRNILLNSAANFPTTYGTAQHTTKESGVTVADWDCDDAFRVAGTSSDSSVAISAIFNSQSHGVSVVSQKLTVGETYTYSMYVRNNHATNTLRVRANSVGAPYTDIAPGEAIRWRCTSKATQDYYIQIQVWTENLGDAFDFTYWHPKIEIGSVMTDWSPAPEDAQADILSVLSYAQGVKAQVDAKIDMWFYAVAPSASAPPESEWSADDKAAHVDDLYYNTATGYCYRYTVSGGVYSWTQLQDKDIASAMSQASTAKDTADGKRRVFTTQPTPPYDKGDLWVQGESGDIKVCSTAKASGASYSATDWVLASKYTDDTAVTNLQIGGRNLLLNSATNFPQTYQGATMTKTSGVTVDEWACTDALRISGAAGTNAIFAMLDATSHGLALSGTNYYLTKSGQSYTYSMWLKNNHATNAVSVRMNAIGSGYVTVAPGAVMRWTDTGTGTGSGTIQITLATTAAGAEYDVTYWHPMIEYGNKASDWKPAKEDTSKEITDAAGAVQANLDNLSVGGRNYLRAMNGVSLTPVAVRCAYSYDADTGTYTLVGNSAGDGYSQIYCNQYNRIDVPERLIGQAMLLHVDEISVSNSLCAPRIYLNFMDDSDTVLQNNILSPTTTKLQVTPPSGTTWMRATLRMDSGNNHQNGDTMTVRGLMLEEGTHRSAWVPAEEDARAKLELELQSVSARINEEADSIRSEVRANYVLTGDLNRLAQTVSTIATQTSDNYTWTVNRINALEADVDETNADIMDQLQTISTYMTFGENGLSIGKTGNPFSFRVTNEDRKSVV